MSRILLILLLMSPTFAAAEAWFDSEPEFADSESRDLAGALLAAHGGMQSLSNAESLQFFFFTKMIGNPNPFYSFEVLDLQDGDAYVEWPFWSATIGLSDETVWSTNWPMPLPAGFFVRLTSSFMTLPWQLHAANANVGPVGQAKLPEDDTLYKVLRVTFDENGPVIPGTYYEVYVHPDTNLMTGIRFDINHPGMAANPKQPLGPNFHVFGDYRDFGGLIFPTFYKSYGQGSTEGGGSNAYHFVWNLSIDEPLDRERLVIPDSAKIDDVSTEWWFARPQATNYQGESK